MFFIYNFLYTLVFSLPLIILSPQDINYKELRIEKNVTVGILGVEYRPVLMDGIAGNVGLGINWDPRYIAFDDTEGVVSSVNKRNKIKADKASKWNFYINYYMKEDSSFYIGVVLNIIRVRLHYIENAGGEVYGNWKETEMLDFYANYLNFGMGLGWHCIWESGFSILVGVDFTTTSSSSFTSIEHINDSLSKRSETKDKVIDKYENESMFPISSKFMIGYSF